MAAEVRERACLSERDVNAIGLEHEGRGGRLSGVGSMVWEFVGAEFGVGEVQFKNSCKCGYQVSLLLEADDGAADGEKVVGVSDCLREGVRDVASLDS